MNRVVDTRIRIVILSMQPDIRVNTVGENCNFRRKNHNIDSCTRGEDNVQTFGEEQMRKCVYNNMPYVICIARKLESIKMWVRIIF